MKAKELEIRNVQSLIKKVSTCEDNLDKGEEALEDKRDALENHRDETDCKVVDIQEAHVVVTKCGECGGKVHGNHMYEYSDKAVEDMPDIKKRREKEDDMEIEVDDAENHLDDEYVVLEALCSEIEKALEELFDDTTGLRVSIDHTKL